MNAAEALTEHALAAHLPIVEGFPRPRWPAIAAIVDSLPPDRLHEHWCAAARVWIEATARHLGAPYAVRETPNFLLLLPLGARETVLVERFVERAWKQIVAELDGLAADDGIGKGVVLLFSGQTLTTSTAASSIPTASTR
jgi:hypothetical protein